MKKILLLITISFGCFNVYGQNNEEFVEIIITDTLQTDPEEIIYTIYCFDNEETSEFIEKKLSKSAAKEKIVKEETAAGKIRSIIIKSGLDTLPSSQLTFQNEMYGGNYKNIFNLHFTSKQKLNGFISDIKYIKGTTGFISNKKTSKTEILIQDLTNRMLKKGLKDATLIANQTGKKLGRLIQVKEESYDEAAGGWTVYPPLSALAQANYGDTSEKITIARKLIIRYLWE